MLKIKLMKHTARTKGKETILVATEFERKNVYHKENNFRFREVHEFAIWLGDLY